MIFPTLRYKKRAVTFIQEFKGYNHNLRSEAGEFYDMKNISMDHYPVISTRHGEADRLALSGTPNALHEYKENTLMAICGTDLIVGITATDDGEVTPGEGWLEDSEKSLATIGAYTLIMPDKLIYNSEDNSYTWIERQFTNKSYIHQPASNHLIMRTIPCDIEGEEFEYEESPTPPNNTDKWWYDTRNKVWMKYSVSLSRWVQIETPYLKVIPAISEDTDSFIDPANVDADEMGDWLTLSNYFSTFEPLDSISFRRIFSATDEQLKDYVIYGVGADTVDYTHEGHEMETTIHYLIISSTLRPKDGAFTVKTKCPELKHLVALNNRIWGVNAENNELFACKLGDPTQWYNYAGIASDSYAVTLGFKDEVTAGVAYNNYVHYFTEDKIIKIYGDYPSNFQLHTTKADGVISGGHDTVVQVDGVLFYVSPIGVMAYDGSLPYFRGQKFAPNYLDGKKVAAGVDGHKYCLSVSEEVEDVGTVSLGVFVYDRHNGLWTIGSDQIYVKTATMNNALCFLNNESRIITCYDRSRETDYVVQEEPPDKEIEWFLETGNLGLDTPNQKYISRLQMRIDYKGSLKVWIAYDNEDEFTMVHDSKSNHMRSITVPIKVKRTDHFRIRLSGVGQMRLYSFGYETDEGSTRCLI